MPLINYEQKMINDFFAMKVSYNIKISIFNFDTTVFISLLGFFKFSNILYKIQ